MHTPLHPHRILDKATRRVGRDLGRQVCRCLGSSVCLVWVSRWQIAYLAYLRYLTGAFLHVGLVNGGLSRAKSLGECEGVSERVRGRVQDNEMDVVYFHLFLRTFYALFLSLSFPSLLSLWAYCLYVPTLVNEDGSDRWARWVEVSTTRAHHLMQNLRSMISKIHDPYIIVLYQYDVSSSCHRKTIRVWQVRWRR